VLAGAPAPGVGVVSADLLPTAAVRRPPSDATTVATAPTPTPAKLRILRRSVEERAAHIRAMARAASRRAAAMRR
jgi:hypothetical protein